MRKIKYLFLYVAIIFVMSSLIVRHDVADERFIALAKKYEEVCHFPVGEGTFIGDQWVLTAAHVAKGIAAAIDVAVERLLSYL